MIWLLVKADVRGMTTNTVTLYRPVGQAELNLIAASDYSAFPPRLPEQPIFYPVLNREYAVQIARDWNTRDERSGYVGYVLEFEVDSKYLSGFEPKKVRTIPRCASATI